MNLANLDLILNKFESQTIVITFVDEGYIKLLDMFSFFWTKLKLNNLLVICLDQASLDRVNNLGLIGLLVPYQMITRNCFWKDRFDMINIIFKKAKKHIVHTDVDCFWFNNIIPQLETDNGDVFYSKAKKHPVDISELYGFVLCCGFFFVKYNERTEGYFDDILNCSNSKDDQVMTNRHVLGHAASIEDIVSADPNNDRVFDKLIMLNEIKVKTINTAIIPREPKKIPGASLFHPYLIGTIDEKVSKVKEYLSHYLPNKSPYCSENKI